MNKNSEAKADKKPTLETIIGKPREGSTAGKDFTGILSGAVFSSKKMNEAYEINFSIKAEDKKYIIEMKMAILASNKVSVTGKYNSADNTIYIDKIN